MRRVTLLIQTCLTLSFLSQSAIAYDCGQIFSGKTQSFLDSSQLKLWTGSGSKHFLGYRGGSKFLLKTPDPLRPHDGVRNEVLAYKISQYLGLNVVPRTFSATIEVQGKKQNVSAQEWIEGVRPLVSFWRQALDTFMGKKRPLDSKISSLTHKQERRDFFAILILDKLLHHGDRILRFQNGENILLDPKNHRIFAVDNSLIYLNTQAMDMAVRPEWQTEASSLMINEGIHSRLQSLHQDLEQLSGDWGLSSTEVKNLRERIQELMGWVSPAP